MSGHRQSRKSVLKSCILPVLEPLEHRALFSAGAIDPSFGTQGSVSTLFPGAHSYAYPSTVLVQQNGESIVVGTAGPANESGEPNQDFALARYTTSGKLDTTFGTNGEVFTDFNGGDDIAVAAALQSNGDIVVAGISNYANPGDIVMARYTPSGALDTSFGCDGRVITFTGNYADEVSGMTIDSQGRIDVVACAGPTDPDKFLVARYQSNGTLDTTFGCHGISEITSGPALDSADAIAAESNGKIVVAGETASGQFYATRLTSTGAIDTTFGTGGFTEVSFGSNAKANSIQSAAFGRIVLGGSDITPGYAGGNFDLTRLNSNGIVDSSFGVNGKVTTNLGQLATANGMTSQTNGDLLMVGSGVSTNDSILVRYTANGQLDKTFNSTGEVFYDQNPAGLSNAFAVAVQADDKILVAGSEGTITQTSVTDHFVLTRFQGGAPGTIDQSYGTQGSITPTFPAPEDSDSAVAVLPLANGESIVVASAAPVEVFGQPSTGTNGFGLARYTAAGTLDTSYGKDGYVFTSFPDGAIATAAVMQPNGEVVVVGSAFDGHIDLARYTTSGALDTTFGNHGMVTTTLPGTYNYSIPTSVVIDGSNRIVVSSVTGLGANEEITVLRYQSNGKLDTTFGAGGIDSFTSGPLYKLMNSPTTNGTVNSSAIESDGKIVIAGASVTGNFYAARLNTNGSLDTTFGAGGITQVNFGESSDAYSVQFVAGGKILLGGTAYNANFDGAFALARLNTNGSLDSTFGSAGKTLTPFGTTGSVLGAMTVQSNGDIILVGSEGVANGYASLIARYTPSGTLDKTFNGGLVVFDTTTSEIAAIGGGAVAVAIQPDGNILVAGDAFSGDSGGSSSQMWVYRFFA